MEEPYLPWELPSTSLSECFHPKPFPVEWGAGPEAESHAWAHLHLISLHAPWMNGSIHAPTRFAPPAGSGTDKKRQGSHHFRSAHGPA